jgi:hypothetical protein
MNTAGIGESACARPRRPHADAGIVFGSVATAPAKKPDSVRAACEAIGLARSTYYYQSHRSASAIELEQKIVLRLHELRDIRPNDGYRRMTQQLQTEGFHINRKRIARLMQLHNLTRKVSRPDGSALRSAQPRTAIANLHEMTQLTGPCQVWLTDVAYGHIRSGLVYAAAVIDVWSREVVGYAASLQITNRLVRIALHSAMRAHRPAPGCIHHWTMAASVSRQIVDIQDYATWGDVLEHPREFIHTLYSRERVDMLLGVQRHNIPISVTLLHCKSP